MTRPTNLKTRELFCNNEYCVKKGEIVLSQEPDVKCQSCGHRMITKIIFEIKK